jgi:hypothetical protein
MHANNVLIGNRSSLFKPALNPDMLSPVGHVRLTFFHFLSPDISGFTSYWSSANTGVWHQTNFLIFRSHLSFQFFILTCHPQVGKPTPFTLACFHTLTLADLNGYVKSRSPSLNNHSRSSCP